MNVRISHGVKLDDVPSTVSEFVKEVIPILEESLDLCELASKILDMSPDSSDTVIDFLDRVRINLGTIDSKLVESTSIYEGYRKAKTQPAQPAPSMEPATVPPETPDVD